MRLAVWLGVAAVGLLGCSENSSGAEQSRGGGGGQATSGASSAGDDVGGAAAGSPAGGGAAGSSAAGTSVGGAAGGNAGSAGSGGAAPSGTPVFVAVGYTGRTIRSLDLGLTWTSEHTLGGGGDDEFLLRAVGYGGGVFVAVGWKIMTSSDGDVWIEQPNPQKQWLGGIQYDQGLFVATGGYGYSARSNDGKAWTAGKSIPNNEASRSLAFGAGKFVTATDPGNWFESSDAMSWTLKSGGHGSTQLAFCDGDFHEYADCSGAFNSRSRATAAGVTIRLEDGKLQRSTDGQGFDPVAGSPSGLEGVAVGLVE